MRSQLTAVATSVLVVSLFLGCSNQEPSDTTPEGALDLFLMSMKAHNDKAAYDLLDPETQKVLQQRARTATQQAGRELKPEEMIAVDRFVMRWEPKNMDAYVEDTRATVTVTGAQPTQKAKVNLRLIKGHWRVSLPLGNE